MPLRSASLAEPYFGTGIGMGASAWARTDTSRADTPPAPMSHAPRLAARSLDVRIGVLFRGSARMGHGAVLRGPDGLRVLPQIARGRGQRARLPGLPPPGQLLVRELDLDRAP